MTALLVIGCSIAYLAVAVVLGRLLHEEEGDGAPILGLFWAFILVYLLAISPFLLVAFLVEVDIPSRAQRRARARAKVLEQERATAERIAELERELGMYR